MTKTEALVLDLIKVRARVSCPHCEADTYCSLHSVIDVKDILRLLKKHGLVFGMPVFRDAGIVDTWRVKQLEVE